MKVLKATPFCLYVIFFCIVLNMSEDFFKILQSEVLLDNHNRMRFNGEVVETEFALNFNMSDLKLYLDENGR